MSRFSYKSFVGLMTCMLGALASASCSKDEFFKIEDTPCVDFQTMYEIATSDLYIDYQKACLLMSNKLSMVDSTNRGRVYVTNKDTIYENVNIISFENVKLLLDSLLKMYPILNDADQADLKDIQFIAFSKNQSLRDFTSNSINNKMMTKGDYNNYNYNSNAIEWIESLTRSYNPSAGSTYYAHGLIEGSFWFFECVPCISVGNAMNLSIIWSRNNEGAIIGGFGWADSGLMMYNTDQEEGYSPLIPASDGNPQPLMDFVLHPNGWLYPSVEDLEWWSKSPEVNIHYIISPNYECSIW